MYLFCLGLVDGVDLRLRSDTLHGGEIIFLLAALHHFHFLLPQLLSLELQNKLKLAPAKRERERVETKAENTHLKLESEILGFARKRRFWFHTLRKRVLLSLDNRDGQNLQYDNQFNLLFLN